MGGERVLTRTVSSVCINNKISQRGVNSSGLVSLSEWQLFDHSDTKTIARV